MHVSEMRALRSFCIRKYLLGQRSCRPVSHRDLKYSQNPEPSRHLYSTGCLCAENSKSWSTYGPQFGDTESKAEKHVNKWATDEPTASRENDGEEADFSSENESQLSFGLRNCDEKNEKRNFVINNNDSPNSRQGHLSQGGSVIFRRSGGMRKKNKTYFVCSDCGYSDVQWWGTCRSCNAINTFKRFSEGETGGGKNTVVDALDGKTRSWLPQQVGEAQPLRLTDVKSGINLLNWRIPLHGLLGSEVARVLGGGLVPGSLVLVGGDPGVGKSTLLLQIAAIIAEGNPFGNSAPVVYVSGEESIEQIGSKSDRMSIGTEDLFLYSSTDIEDILRKIQPLSPRALIIDSIQTVYLETVPGSAGGLSQLKECTSALLRFAKKTNIPVLLIGHVTKTGDIAGPRVLEHIVDVVLYMEGEKYSSHRLLRSVKNRFGSSDELGVFEMSQSGLQAVSKPGEIFLSEDHADSDVLVGLAVAAIMDGSRTFLVEVQALCVSGSSISRQVHGIQSSRADMIISVLMKQAGLKLQENAIFLNVVSGMTLKETAGDLAIAASICSSFLEFPIPKSVAFIGEIGLAGELRTVARMDKRVSAVAMIGYKRCVVPKSAEKSLATLGFEGMEILGCRNLKEVINAVFK